MPDSDSKQEYGGAGSFGVALSGDGQTVLLSNAAGGFGMGSVLGFVRSTDGFLLLGEIFTNEPNSAQGSHLRAQCRRNRHRLRRARQRASQGREPRSAAGQVRRTTRMNQGVFLQERSR